MTKRLPDSERKIRARDDLTPKPRKKSGRNATPEGTAERIAKLRATAIETSTHQGAEQANPDRPLTEKQKLFAKIWAQGETIRSAAMKAGYTADGAGIAYRLCRDPAILKIYNREKALYEESCQMTRKRVMDGLLEGIEMAKMLDEPASVIGGWREIGKMCGYYAEQKRTVDINIKGEVTVKQLERMDDASLLKLIKGEVEDITDVVYVESDAETGEDSE